MLPSQECYEIYWTNPGSNFPWNSRGAATSFYVKNFTIKTDKTCGTVLEKSGWTHLTLSYGPFCIVAPVFTDQQELTYNSSVRTQNVFEKTCWKRWMIGMTGEREFQKSLQAVWHDDDDDDDDYTIYQPLRSGRIWHKVNFLAEFNRFKFRVSLLLD